jgi:hypothetical protein
MLRLKASHFFLTRQEKVIKKNATPIPQIAATLQRPSFSRKFRRPAPAGATCICSPQVLSMQNINLSKVLNYTSQ